MASPSTVPHPPFKPVVGNFGDIDPNAPLQSLIRLAKIYGPFFKLRIFSREFYVASSQALVNELCDEARFGKRVHASLEEIRAFAGDGLFTAYDDEPNWEKAHRLLMPAFGPIGIRGMFDKMVDIADQMFVRWERFGPNAVIDVADNMTRLTLDTIALCAFDTRFNSFYQNEMHPFVAAMVGALDEAGQRGRRPDLVSNLMLSRARRYEADRKLLQKVAHGLIADRRGDPRGAEKGDLLAIMLNGVDAVTGETLTDENIGYQMITFLIAGHETTSGLLSFATYLLLENPEVLREAQGLVDEVLGDEMPRVEHLAKLRFIEQILMESLRLWPTAAVFAVHPHQATTLAGRYPLTPEETVLILEPMLHRDSAVWGDDVEAFRPERFAPENAEKLPPNAWKPFGNGKRACIGRAFAMQEAQLVLAMMLRRFDIVLDDPAYRLQISETLTIKPHGLAIRARARHGGGLRVGGGPAAPQRALSRPAGVATAPTNGAATPLLLLYGSNTGTSEAFARRIAEAAPAHGYAPVAAALDDHAGRLPREGAVIIVTASYEGQPPDNARQFVSSVEALGEGGAEGVKYAVFGCGNRQWARTYQAIPKRVDAALERAGATRIRSRGEADAGGDLFGAFDAWQAALWTDLGAALGKAVADTEARPLLDVEILRTEREGALQLADLRQGTIVENRELVDVSAGGRSKRHIEIALPPGMTYRSGDYLAVLPCNGSRAVERALRRFGLAGDTQVVLRRTGAGSTALPLDHPVGASDLLANYVELAQPATRAQVRALAEATRCPPEREPLLALAEDVAYQRDVLDKRLAVLDLLERFQSCDLGFGPFLEMLPPLRARQYSISSSPLWKADHVTLTMAVLDVPSVSGHGRFSGVASTYLAGLEPGARVSVAVRPSNARFHPPEDVSTPMIMVCAGTGVAPFHGFLQERAIQKDAGQPVGPALLFFGVDHPDIDYLYRDVLARWERDGVVQVAPAFSALPEGPVTYVQDRVWQDREAIAGLFRRGASVYVCGDGKRMAPAVRETFVKMYREVAGVSQGDADAWADTMERDHGRYVSDVYA